ncbi:hypothetical protein AB0F17_08615 [Nonomuraea sp. NPDC026600]|uniref:hypothetical protein n=1 Tax=Nonomuraea sp. NPDC026600 TaxID=3155363 RepID=UPI0033D1B19C
MSYVWPSREEWAAAAEYSVRTACYPLERVPEGVEHYLSADEVKELDQLQTSLSEAARFALTQEIRRLRGLLPPRPSRTSERIAWYDQLTPEQRAAAQRLGTLEYARTDVGRRARGETSAQAGWYSNVACYHHVTDGVVAEFVEDRESLERLVVLEARYKTLRHQASVGALASAIAREVAKRNSDEGWAKELERRARIDGSHVITPGPQDRTEQDHKTEESA